MGVYLNHTHTHRERVTPNKDKANVICAGTISSLVALLAN